MARMRLLIGRRFIGRVAIRKIGAGMELSHLDVLSIIRRSRDRQEVTVGSIAEQMRIDPSRGSRIVADLVKRGILKRVVSQMDARRTVVEMTPEGEKLLAQIDEAKTETITSIVGDWPVEDRLRFAALFDRFVTGFEQRYQQFVEQDSADRGGEAEPR